MRHLSEKETRNWRRNTRLIGEEVSVHFPHPLFWLVLALCRQVPGWVGFGMNKWKKLRQIRWEAVCPSSETERRRDEAKAEKRNRRRKRRGKEEKKDYTASKSRTWLLTPSTKNFFYFKLFRHLTSSQVEFQPQWIVQRPSTFLFFFFFIAIQGFFRRKMADAKFDLKLIFEFDGSTSVVDWIKTVELTCRVCGVKRRTGGALDVYLQLGDNEKADVRPTNALLFKAFAMDPCTAYGRFTTWTLIAGETVNVFFAALKKLAILFRGFSEPTFIYAFVAGLPDRVKQVLRASTSIEATPIEHEPSSRMKQNWGVVMVAQTAQSGHTNPPRLDPRAKVNCFRCGRIGHIAKDCTNKRRCFHCGGIGHIASNCPGNKLGNKMSVPLCFPDKMWTRCNQSSEYTLTNCLFSALFDLGCSRTIVSARLFHTWSKR